MEQRETFTSKLGFVLASIGAAIGLGNIWMFPWRLGAYGGAAFLVPYFLFVFGLVSAGLMGEFAFGRSQQKGAIGSFENVFKNNPRLGALLGTVPVIGVSGVFVFYVIVVGWILKYLFLSILGSFGSIDIAAYFGGFAGQPESIFWHILSVLITLIIIRSGVQKGIEKTNKFMIPALFILLIILLFRSLTLPGSMEGVKFMLVPDWSKLAEPVTWIMALGQAFFTVSLGGAAMLVYGSYLKKNEDIKSSAIQTITFNTLASLLAAFVIIPAVFAFGLDPQAGPPLLFITVPNIFKMMPGGYIFGILFFLSVAFAGISSALNLMEVPVEALMERLDWSRKKSTYVVAIVGLIIGLFLDVNMGRFGKFADFVTIYLIPLGAVLAGFVFFWIYGAAKARKEINQGAKKPLGKWFEGYAKYVFVLVALAVLILGIVYGGIG